MEDATDVNLNIVPQIAAVARPGDTILVGFGYALSDAEIEEIERNFRPLVNQGIKIGFIDQVTSMVVAKGSAESGE